MPGGLEGVLKGDIESNFVLIAGKIVDPRDTCSSRFPVTSHV